MREPAGRQPVVLARSLRRACVAAAACALAAASAAAHADGAAQEAYATYCGGCHQFDGVGIPGTYPALAGSAIVNGEARELLRLVLDGGFENVAMPRFGGVLDDELVAMILTYVRVSWGNQSPPISAAEVANRHAP